MSECLPSSKPRLYRWLGKGAVSVEEALVYAVPLDDRIYEACLETMGVASGAENRRVSAVGVLVPLLSTPVVFSWDADGSSTSFSARGILFFLGVVWGSF